MRSAAVLSLTLAASCAANPGLPPVHGERAGHQCRVPSVALVAGAPSSSAIGERLLRESKAATLRWIAFGAMVTQDYRSDRLNIRLDAERRVVSADCG